MDYDAVAVKWGSASRTQKEEPCRSSFGSDAVQEMEVWPSDVGLRGPETFDFLGFTHICAKNKNGEFWLRRMAKLKQVKDQLRRRRHWPVPEQGKWLASVV